MIVLPTLQRRIRGDFFRLVLLFGVLGLLLVGAIFVAGRMPTLLMRMNYDSIAWARDMETAMNALRFPDQYPENAPARWKEIFETALTQAGNNITEVEEPQVLERLQQVWTRFQTSTDAQRGVDDAYKELRLILTRLVQVNEQGMLERLNHHAVMRDVTVLGAALLFALGTLWAIFMADAIAGKVSHPLRRAAEVFKSRPRLGSLLHLPPPQTLEVRILFDELARLWSRLSELDALNVGSLMAEKRKLEVILESADDAILVLDGSGSVAHVSQRMLPLLGLDPVRTLGLSWRDLPTASANYLALREMLNADLQGKRDIFLLENGEERMFTARRRDLLTPDGQAVGQVFLLSDVTESRRREGLRSEMMDWVAHELKTPMQSLCLAADLLNRRKAGLDPEGRLLVETVHEDAARLRTLAQQFLDIARMAPTALRLSPELVDLASLLERWLRPFMLVARETGIRLTVEANPELPKIVLDAERFAWVVSNLVANAVHASSSGEEVRVRAGLSGQTLVLDVEDQGPGLPESVQARLFEPFSHGRTAGTQAGLFGLGLAISRSIVEAHGGRIEHAPLEPRGSRFTVFLPLDMEAGHAD
jgi:NtrC-family two-component system sensor histidine kinase KinB